MFKICIICLMLKTKEKYFFLYTCILRKCIQLLKAMYGYFNYTITNIPCSR